MLVSTSDQPAHLQEQYGRKHDSKVGKILGEST